MAITNQIYQLYFDLKTKYGEAKEFWPQWCAARKTLRDREVIALGAILTQRTSWHNADIALRNLKKSGLLSLQKIADLGDFKPLVELVRPAGFYQSKPRRLYEFSSFIIKDYGGFENFRKEKLITAREKLLNLYGIGPETADTILLYSLDRATFVIDEYTKRLVKKEGLATVFSYDYLKNLFEKSLPPDVKTYQEFHTLIIVEQKGKKGSIMSKI